MKTRPYKNLFVATYKNLAAVAPTRVEAMSMLLKMVWVGK